MLQGMFRTLSQTTEPGGSSWISSGVPLSMYSEPKTMTSRHISRNTQLSGLMTRGAQDAFLPSYSILEPPAHCGSRR